MSDLVPKGEALRLTENQDEEVHETSIDGLYTVALKVRVDERGNFREVWRKEWSEKHGLPEFDPLQWNLSETVEHAGLRGIHAEPWDKYITPAKGDIYVAYVDLRKGDTFGQVEEFTLSEGQAVFVPQGCGNSFEVLSDWALYAYLVTDYWQPGISYPSVHPFDPELGINWPIGQDQALLSEKDQNQPFLKDVTPVEV